MVKKSKIILTISYGNDVPKLQNKHDEAEIIQLVIGLEPGKLDLTGKCALPVTKTGIKKKRSAPSKTFKLS